MLFQTSVVNCTISFQWVTTKMTTATTTAMIAAIATAIPPPIATAAAPKTPTSAAIASTTGAIATTTWMRTAIIPAKTATSVIIVATNPGFSLAQFAIASTIGVMTGTIAFSAVTSRLPRTGISGVIAWRICVNRGASCLIASPTTGPSVAAICPNASPRAPTTGASAGRACPSPSAPVLIPSKSAFMPFDTAGSASSLPSPSARELIAEPALSIAWPSESPSEGSEDARDSSPGFMLSIARPADSNILTNAWCPSTVDMARLMAARPSARPESVVPPAS